MEAVIVDLPISVVPTVTRNLEMETKTCITGAFIFVSRNLANKQNLPSGASDLSLVTRP